VELLCVSLWRSWSHALALSTAGAPGWQVRCSYAAHAAVSDDIHRYVRTGSHVLEQKQQIADSFAKAKGLGKLDELLGP
jgi:hypothetical protein